MWIKLILFHFINQFFNPVYIFSIEMFEPSHSDEINHREPKSNGTKENYRKHRVRIIMGFWHRLQNDNHFANKKRHKTQVKRNVILLVQLKLMQQIFQRIQSSQSWIADFFIKFEKFCKKERCHQSHRNHQNFEVKIKSKRQRKKPNYNQYN